jgi:hypothetical protein
VTASPTGSATAEVWGSTWIPEPSPIEGFGDDAGYSIAWVRVGQGPMLQVIVEDVSPPAPGVTGEVRSHPVDDEAIDVFTPAAGGDA